jgi:hypothetical protein
MRSQAGFADPLGKFQCFFQLIVFIAMEGNVSKAAIRGQDHFQRLIK